MSKARVMKLAAELDCSVEASRVPPGMGGYTEVCIEPIGDWELEPDLTGWVCQGWEDAERRLEWLAKAKGGK
jgi:hypothetical protein